MNEYVTWGGAGILLALVGALTIASEIQHGLAEGNMLEVGYGLAVVFAALVTILVIAPSFRGD